MAHLFEIICVLGKNIFQFLRPNLIFKIFYEIYAGYLNEAGDINIPSSVRGGHPIFAILVGIFSSTLGGISYCLIRAGAKASDHPVY